jgi:hypothetical protein
VNGINAAAYTYVALDWEAVRSGVTSIQPTSPVTAYWERVAMGYFGLAAQQSAVADGIALVTELKARCPGKKFGFYFLPENLAEDYLDGTNTATYAQKFYECANASSPLRALWNIVDFIAPDRYMRRAVQPTVTSPNISAATDLTRESWFANLCLQLAEFRSGGVGEVFPFILDRYQFSLTTEVPLEEWHNHLQRWAQTTRAGRRAAGVMWWHGGSATYTDITEAKVKAVYQAINLLPYNPNMPRPGG